LDYASTTKSLGHKIPTTKLHINGTEGGITFYPNVAPVVMNTTSQNLSISSAGGSVIIQLG